MGNSLWKSCENIRVLTAKMLISPSNMRKNDGFFVRKNHETWEFRHYTRDIDNLEHWNSYYCMKNWNMIITTFV